MDVTTWYLEQTSPGQLRSAKDPAAHIEIALAEIASPEFSRFLYSAVGAPWLWTDRLSWTPEQWDDYLARGVETWVAYERGKPAGYIELDPQDGGSVEIAYFGLLPHAMGKRIGGRLLEFGTARAWDLAARHPGRAETTRVWVHTCTLDGPAALSNYRARGFEIYLTEVTGQHVDD
jgi:GNAT superfamily N-acetyltransferase